MSRSSATLLDGKFKVFPRRPSASPMSGGEAYLPNRVKRSFRGSAAPTTKPRQYGLRDISQHKVPSVTKIVELAGDKIAFEKQYRHLGWTTGPYSGEAVQNDVRSFWKHRGRTGAEWLARRIRDEFHMDILSAVADVIGEIGEAARRPVMDTLKARTTSTNQAVALLKGLGSLGPPANPTVIKRTRRLIRSYFDHPDTEVREAAAVATRCLPAQMAQRLLNDSLAVESNWSVRETFEEEIDNRA